MKTRIANMFLIAATLVSGSFANAASAKVFECRDGKGVKVSYASERSIRNEDGYTTGETLVGNEIQIQFENETILLTPDKSLANGVGAVLAAFTADGQYVIVNALLNTSDPGYDKEFAGHIDLRVKTKQGVLERRAGTKVVCVSPAN